MKSTALHTIMSAKSLYACLLIACGLSSASIQTASSQPYVWTTIVGLPGSSGSADGTNNEARFLRPTGIARDSAGTLYVADFNNAIHQVRHLGSDWVATTIAGLPGTNNFGSADGTNSDARFNLPYGVAVDSTGA